MAANNSLNDLLSIIQARIQLLEDREALLSILSRYSINIDLNRIENALKLWTEDCVFTSDVSGKTITLQGKPELRKMFSSPPPKSQHIQLDYVVTVNGHRATAIGYQLMPQFRENKINIGRSSLREFKFRRINGTWLISYASSTSITDEEECRKILPDDF